MNRSRRSQGKPLSESEKRLILNVCQRCREEAESLKLPVSNIYGRTACHAGVGRKAAAEIVSYFRKSGTVPPPAKAGNKSSHKTPVSSDAACHIRRFIFERHREGGSCNAKHIQDLSDKNLI